MSATFDTTEFEYDNAVPSIMMQMYSSFCAPSCSYSVPFCAHNFKLSFGLSVKPLHDEQNYITKCKIVRINDNQGVLVFSTASRLYDNAERVILEINDMINGVQAYFTVAKGYDLCNSFSCDVNVDQKKGILDCRVSATGLPWATRTYWYVAEPAIEFLDENNATLDVTVLPNLNIFNQVVLCRANATYDSHYFTAILNRSLYGKATCKWVDRIGGGSATKTFDVNYTK